MATAEQTPEPRPLAGGVVMSAASRVTVAVTGALTTILIARLLGPDGSGGYVIAQSIVLLLGVATTLGVEHGITYYVSSGAWGAPGAFRSSLRVATLTGGVGVLVGIAARLLVPSAFSELSVPVTIVACAGLPFWLAWFYATFVALAVDRYEAYVLPPALQSTLALVLSGVGAVAFGLGAAVVGMTLATVTVGVGAVVYGLRRLPQPDLVEEPGQLRRAIGFGLKGYAANALQLLNYRLDLFILSAAASAAQVGYYSVAVAVTSVLWLLPPAVAEVIFPRVAHLTAREGAEAEREMVEAKGLRHVVLIVAVSVVVLVGALQWLVVPVYGEAFRPAVRLGMILLPGVALIGLGGVLSSTIVGRGKPIYSLYAVLITMPPTLLLYALLIPAYGATGAALASSISYAANFAVACFFYRRVTGRGVGRLLVPTRDELRDLAALPRAVRAWVRGLRT